MVSMEAPTATLPPLIPRFPTISMISVLPRAMTFTSPLALMTALSPIAAFTVSPTTTTAAEPVTAALPSVTPPLITTLINFLSDVAVTVTLFP